MQKKLLVLASDSNAERICKIANFFNIKYNVISGHFTPDGNTNYALITNESNVGVAKSIPNLKAVLVYDCKTTTLAQPYGTFCIGTSRLDITNQFSGLSMIAPCKGANILKSPQDNFHNLIQIDGQPFFILRNKNGCDWFSLGYSNIVDLNIPVNDKYPSLDDFFPAFIPYAMFFKYAFNIKYQSAACLVIDDPCLWTQYGLIDFMKAVNLVRAENFSITVAFIPWNHNRSQRKLINLFANNQDKLSICVHGCDHTSREFGSSDSRILNWKASLAKKRMEQHKKRYGLSYDNVMVFPQGIFSNEAMQVLQQHGYSAAVNTEILSSNYDGGLTLSDLITPATLKYSFPLFLRRNHFRIEDYAYDLFFGRPIIIVQHNQDFFDGWDRQIAFIKQLNILEPNLNWTTLGEIVAKMCTIQPTIQINMPSGSYGYTPKLYMKTLTRRLLCDFRDTVVHKHKILRSISRQ